MVHIDVHSVLKLVRRLALHCFSLALVATFCAILLAGVESHEFRDKGIVGVEVELIGDPLVGGRG